MNKNRRGAVLTRPFTENNAKLSDFNLCKKENMKQFSNNNSQFLNNNSGITLIALVVTIVVLLILAGVSLNLVAGGDGIIDKASTAVDATNVANAQEAVNLFISEKTMGYYSSAYLDDDNTYSDIQSYIVGQIGNGLEYSGYYLTANSVGDIFVHSRAGSSDIITTVSIDSSGNTVSGGETYTVTLNANGGSVDKNSITVRAGSKYGTLPTPTNGDLKFVGWGTSTDATTYIASTSNVDITSDTTLYAIWRENTQSFNAAHPEYHIPTGFQYKEGTVATGYVITDASNPSSNSGNEFVWIPVADDEAYAKKLGTNNYYLSKKGDETAESLSYTVSNGIQGDVIGGTGTILGTTVSATLANAPEYAVVKKAGGFWVGRYEAGIESTSSADTIANQGWTNQTIVEKAGVQPARYMYQTEALSLANSWGSGNEDATKATVKWQSGLITGSQWDAMCKFIGWSIADSDCSTWGNYNNTAGQSYIGYHSSHQSLDWVTDTITKTGDYTNKFIFPTARFVTSAGASTVQKNIYDIAGNVWEWTTEVPQYSASNSVLRGGSASDSGANVLASCRYGIYSSTTYRSWALGFRLVLYVQ